MPFGLGRRGVDDAREAVERPQLPTVAQIVADQLQGAGDDELLLAVDFPDHRRRIAACETVARRLPGGLAVVLPHGQQKAVEIVILVQDHLAVDQDRRAGRAKLIAKRSQLFRPQRRAVQVVAQQAIAAEERDDALAVAGARRRRGAPFAVNLFELLDADRSASKASCRRRDPGRS